VLLGIAVMLAMVGSRSDLLVNILAAHAVIQAGFLVLRLPTATIAGVGLDPTLVRYLTSLACWIAAGITALCCALCMGLSSGRPSEQVVLALTVAIGAGAQPILSNFSAGLLLIIFRPYRVGDWVTVGDETFEVTSVLSFFTHGKSAKAQLILPNAKAISATIANVSARPSQLLIVPVHVRTGLKPCKEIRAAFAAAAREFELRLASALECAGVKDAAAVATSLPKCNYLGPLLISERGMRWELRAEVPMQAQLQCTGLANECLHDALFSAGIKIFEGGESFT